MASEELSKKLQHRNVRNDALDAGNDIPPTYLTINNPYTEFKEFSRKQIQAFEKHFKKYDTDMDKRLSLDELKVMMEKLGSPQTHLGLKAMINEVDEDKDSCINFREFLLIFRKASEGELPSDSGLYDIYHNVCEIDVGEAGVKGAKGFFEAKIEDQARQGKFLQEVIDEQNERKLEEENAKRRREEFKNKAALFGSQ